MKKITTFTLLFLTFICTETLYAQIGPDVLWAKQYGGENANIPSHIATDIDGNTYITGTFWPEINFEDTILTGQGLETIFIAKTDPSGTVLWAKQFGGTGHDRSTGITTDSQGNVYTTGFFTGEVTFGSITLDAGAGIDPPDTFVIKQDPSGNVLWAKQFINTQNFSSVDPKSIVTDTQNNVYTAGDFNSETITFGAITLTRTDEATRNLFVVKQDPLGNVLWAKNFGGNKSVIVKKITSDVSDNIYLTGSFSGTVNFGEITLTDPEQGASNSNIFLVKLNALGEVIWAKNFGGNVPGGFARVMDIALDTTGSLYLTGDFFGTLQIGNTTLSPGGLFVIKTDDLGEVLWAKKFGDSETISLGITTDVLNNIYLVGRFANNIWFDDVYLSSAGSIDAFVVKMDSSGTTEWAGRFGAGGGDAALGATIDTSGNLLVLGTFFGTVTFGTTTFTAVSNGRDIFLLKLSPDGLATEKNQIKNWKVYPNPTNDFITLDFPDSREFSVEVLNLLGQKIKLFENLNSTENLDLSELKTGIYLLNINQNGTIQTIKIKKQ